jgi:hypothetical protein
MIERKRRNDFVRKREFDMLRKVRREGLSPEQLAALGSPRRARRLRSRCRRRQPRPRTDVVKAKIDEIEQQMVGEASGFRRPRRAGAQPVYFDPSRRASHSHRRRRHGARRPPSRPTSTSAPRAPPSAPPLPDAAARVPDRRPARAAAGRQAGAGADGRRPAAAGADGIACRPQPRPAPIVRQPAGGRGQRGRARPRARRSRDRLRQCRLRPLRAIADSADQPGRRATSMPKPGWCCSTCTAPPASSRVREPGDRLSPAVRLVGAAVVFAAQAGGRCGGRRAAAVAKPRRRLVGWVAPAELDIDAVASLRSQTLQMPLPWVFDWAGCAASTPKPRCSCRRCSACGPARRWRCAGCPADRLFGAAGAAPTGVKDADPAFWLARAGCAAPGQPARPVRRDGDRLLRHLRGVAAVVGAHALQRAHQRRQRHVDPPAADVHRQRGEPTGFLESGLLDDSQAPSGGDGRAVGPADRATSGET